ncbi:hypothetical protein BpHYR1_040157 [Brachionus plicatilis]|uniref:Uncharacterized protein n=1 Tax=Brachionus plicatilis TaxID=10195 RepID=A0A3M7SJ38_BRAPC|nr:hypothetical protein BpHYR1_040157 [Brachionus plicatilis]
MNLLHAIKLTWAKYPSLSVYSSRLLDRFELVESGKKVERGLLLKSSQNLKLHKKTYELLIFHRAFLFFVLRANIRKERILHIRSEAPSAQLCTNSFIRHCFNLLQLLILIKHLHVIKKPIKIGSSALINCEKKPCQTGSSSKQSECLVQKYYIVKQCSNEFQALGGPLGTSERKK